MLCYRVSTDEFQTAKELLSADVGHIGSREGPPSLKTIQDIAKIEQNLLVQAFDAVGPKEVSPRALAFLPPWLLEKAIDAERLNFIKVVEEQTYEEAGPTANILTSSSFYKIKAEQEGFRMKCRLVPHGNKDNEKGSLRTDSATSQSATIRMVLVLAMMLWFRLGTIDVVAAFLQSVPLLRSVYIRPPRGWCTRGALGKLLKPAYGLVESGRLWQIEVEKWIFSRGFVIITGAPQAFVLRKDGNITMILAKVVDDILCCSSPKHTN
jgi:Reverse transcriptase (RNA-dependent DNA polymerase)